MIKLTDIRNVTGDPYFPDNKSLKNKTGKHEYTIAIYTKTEPRRFLFHKQEKGSVIYPFVVRKVELEDGDSGFTIDHLPTGSNVVTYKLRKTGVNKIKKVLRETRKGAFDKVSFTDGNYKKLQEIFI